MYFSFVKNLLFSYRVCPELHSQNIIHSQGTLKPQATDHYTAIRLLVRWPLMTGLFRLVQRGGTSVPISYCSMWHYSYLCTVLPDRTFTTLVGLIYDFAYSLNIYGLSFFLSLSLLRWHTLPSHVIAEACLTGWPNAQLQGRD